jgi:ESCRT-II complex subunit VPS25
MGTEEGGKRAEWTSAAGKSKAQTKEKAWIYWKRPEEWAGEVEKWVDNTGQKGSVLTFWEIVEGDASRSEDFHSMDAELLHKCLQVLVKRGKAQIFGQDDQLGVKFY